MKSKRELSESYVKEYFSQNGTVSTWWEPEEETAVIYQPHYLRQKMDLLSLVNFKNKKVLDTGTRKGRFAIAFAKNGAKEVVAVDVSNEMLKIAKKRAENEGVDGKITFELGDIEQLKYENEFFDIACCMETFIHLPNPQKAMNEITRVCKKDGKIIVEAGIVAPPMPKSIINKFTRNIYYWKPMHPLRVFANRYFNKPIEKKKPKSNPVRAWYIEDDFLQLFKFAEITIERVVEYPTTRYNADFPKSCVIYATKHQNKIFGGEK